MGRPARRLLRPGELDLVLGFRWGWHSALIAGAAGAGFGLFMAMADATVFREAVPLVQQVLLTSLSTGDRLRRFLPGAVMDELALRLVGMTALVWLLASVVADRPAWIYRAAILLTAGVLWPLWAAGYLAGLDGSGLSVAREVVLHLGAGALWGWLYWRHGWLAGLTGHCAAHLVLQPLLTALASGG